MKQLMKDEVENKTYLKVCQNKARMGPVDVSTVADRNKSQLSAAANKIRVMADFSVKVNTENKKEVPENSQNISWLVFSDAEVDTQLAIKQAICLMQAWEETFAGSPGTKDYMKKLGSMLNARAGAYKKIGVKYDPHGERPNLTAEQRAVYNSIVGEYAFDYYEYHLAFKFAGEKRFIRSKTIRSLRPLEIEAYMKKLMQAATMKMSELDISVRQAN